MSFQIPKLAFGTSGIEESIVTETIRTAIRVGFKHFDCASRYLNESLIGPAIAESDRSQLFITSKCWPNSFRNVRQSCEQSIRDLQCEYLDLYLLHWPYAEKGEMESGELDFYPIQSVWEQMEALKDSGLVKHIGVSNWTVPLLNDMLSYCRVKPECNQVEMHPYYKQKNLNKFCQKYEIQLFGYSVLGRPSFDIAMGSNIRMLDDVTLNEIATKNGISSAQVCIAYVLSKGGAIVKASSEGRMAENLATLNIQLPQEDLERIDNIETELKFIVRDLDVPIPILD